MFDKKTLEQLVFHLDEQARRNKDLVYNEDEKKDVVKEHDRDKGYKSGRRRVVEWIRWLIINAGATDQDEDYCHECWRGTLLSRCCEAEVNDEGRCMECKEMDR